MSSRKSGLLIKSDGWKRWRKAPKVQSNSVASKRNHKRKLDDDTPVKRKKQTVRRHSVKAAALVSPDRETVEDSTWRSCNDDSHSETEYAHLPADEPSPDSDFYEAKKRVKRTPGDGTTRKPEAAIERPPVKISKTQSEGDGNWQIWTPDEVILLKELEKGYTGRASNKWSSLAQSFFGKSPDDCMVKWFALEGKTRPVYTHMNEWTREEKLRLLDARALYGGKNWITIAKQFPSRTVKACNTCFLKQLDRGWPSESVLILLYETYGPDWKTIGEQMSKYAPRDIMQRLMLKRWQPEIRKGESAVANGSGANDVSPMRWSKEEDEFILNQRALYGCHWLDFTGRSGAAACRVLSHRKRKALLVRARVLQYGKDWPRESILVTSYEEFGPEWTEIATQNNWRSPKEIAEYWTSRTIGRSLSMTGKDHQSRQVMGGQTNTKVTVMEESSFEGMPSTGAEASRASSVSKSQSEEDAISQDTSQVASSIHRDTQNTTRTTVSKIPPIESVTINVGLNGNREVLPRNKTFMTLPSRESGRKTAYAHVPKNALDLDASGEYSVFTETKRVKKRAKWAPRDVLSESSPCPPRKPAAAWNKAPEDNSESKFEDAYDEQHSGQTERLLPTTSESTGSTNNLDKESKVSIMAMEEVSAKHLRLTGVGVSGGAPGSQLEPEKNAISTSTSENVSLFPTYMQNFTRATAFKTPPVESITFNAGLHGNRESSSRSSPFTTCTSAEDSQLPPAEPTSKGMLHSSDNETSTDAHVHIVDDMELERKHTNDFVEAQYLPTVDSVGGQQLWWVHLQIAVLLMSLLFVMLEIILVSTGVLRIKVAPFDGATYQFLQAAIESARGIPLIAFSFWLLYNGPFLDSVLLSSILLTAFASIDQ